VTDQTKKYDVFDEEALSRLGEGTSQLARVLWMYYSALKQEGFGDLQAIQLCYSLQTILLKDLGN
jgi:hypothetical protein